ncbi:hypothetical protein JCGZ_24364 [Jatropha curcas]|uniref:Uncharacterized protein n=1 Tax=Jatropha curcas TaxID=180498 RepID=A0A067LDL9_JATCU|nr:hypothetical protein JCGZ_24364 [Jatropha curcas]
MEEQAAVVEAGPIAPLELRSRERRLETQSAANGESFATTCSSCGGRKHNARGRGACRALALAQGRRGRRERKKKEKTEKSWSF